MKKHADVAMDKKLIKKEIKKAEDKAKEIRKVTAKEIQDLAKNIFQDKKLNLALIGPFQYKDNFTKILKF